MAVGRSINKAIFRAYDIRGIYPNDIDEDIANRIGKAFGEFIGPGKKVLVGRDVRVSGPSLTEHLLSGILDTGLEVVYAGIIPTPLLGFAVSHYKLDGGIQVSASHNPSEWNGFKVCREESSPIGLDSGLNQIREMADKAAFGLKAKGKMVDKSKEIMKDYLDFLSDKVSLRKGLRVGIDPGNGAYSKIASGTFKKKGAFVKAINDVPDGTFPSRSPEPKESTITELIELVKSQELDFGVAFDSDGDRALFVTDKGQVLGGDVVLALFVSQYLNKGEAVAYEVTCSNVIEDEIKRKGGIPVISKVGYINIREKMKENRCKFGGEISSHLYFQEIYGIDDGLYSALKMADLLSKSKKKLSELAAELPRYVNRYEEYDADDKIKFRVMEKIKEKLSKGNYKLITLDGIKVITPKGWFVLRVSNTTPKIKCRVEARNERDLDDLASIATKAFDGSYSAIKGKS